MEGGREGEREGGREGGREGERERGREKPIWAGERKTHLREEKKRGKTGR
jgi:hypothetical protein